ncbi:YbaK/EbsC family protein, partial [Streptomyces sp. NPDC059525]
GKRAAMADPALAERTTGYVRGGISPLGQRRRLPTVLDASASGHATICVSAGRRGLEVELDPAALATLTGAVLAPIARA